MDKALNPLSQCYPHLYMSHYMDDALFAGPSLVESESVLQILPEGFTPCGLIIIPEMSQKEQLINYLGYTVAGHYVHPLRMKLKTDCLKTLN